VREWEGTWSDYEAARSRARGRQYETWERAEERRREVVALLHERRAQARAGGAMANRRGTQALRSKVRQAERALERVGEAAKPYEPWELRLSLGRAPRAADTVVALAGAVAVRGSFRLGPLDLELAPGERLAVTGRNGSGKSTLLALLLGELEPSAGSRRLGRGAVVGALDQARTAYAGAEPLVRTFTARSHLPPEDARTLLAKFDLRSEHVDRPGATLSAGERTRAQLAELSALGVNLLVLDEPTNHLDLEAIEQLEAALAAYEGALVVVSHDRRFLERVAPTREPAL
jgi:ATPase subunit of ABC transporter with duplicated ATPase domains